MKEKKEMSKKRLIAYYLALAGCLLLIAAITVTVIFAVRKTDSGQIDNDDKPAVTPPDDKDDEDDKPDDGDGGDDSQNTSSQYEFIVPVRDVNVTTGYTFYHNQTLNSYYLHEGMDFSAEAGAEVLAALDGTVVSITTGDELYGTVITLSHANDITTTYTYVDAAEGLKAGDAVKRGDVIATVAEANGSEYKDGAHLHFEVYEKGVIVDPETKLDISDK